MDNVNVQNQIVLFEKHLPLKSTFNSMKDHLVYKTLMNV